MEKLLKKHAEMQNKADKIVREYSERKALMANIISLPYNIMKNRKELINLKKEYEKTREDIYGIEDEIATFDKDILNDIVEPLQEDIDEQIYFVMGTC